MAKIDLQGVFPPIATPFMDGKVAHEKLDANVKKWSKTEGHYDWLNSGVMLFSSNEEHEWIMEYDEDEFFKFDDMPLLYDMPYMIYKINKHDILVVFLDKRFNTIVYFEDYGDFLHFDNVNDRDERINKYKEI